MTRATKFKAAQFITKVFNGLVHEAIMRPCGQSSGTDCCRAENNTKSDLRVALAYPKIPDPPSRSEVSFEEWCDMIDDPEQE